MSSHNLINKEILAEICPQLKQLRLECQLNIEELHIAPHISVREIKRIENGRFLTFSHLRCLLDFYGKKMRIVLEE